MTGVGFEPTPPKRLVPKTSALDHSAKLPYSAFDKSINIFIPSKYDYISYKTAID